MHITINATVHVHSLPGETAVLLREAVSTLTTILERIDTMLQQITDLGTKVAALTSAAESAEALLGGLKTALDAAIANAVTSGDLAQLQQLSETLGTQTSNLAAAVAANTPS